MPRQIARRVRCRGQQRRDERTLHDVAASLIEEAQLRRRFDAGGDGLDPQPMREADRRPDDRPAAALRANSADDGGIDPDPADRQAGERGQRQDTAGTGRVERARDPMLIQNPERILQPVGRMAKHRVLGDVDLQMRGIETETAEQVFRFGNEAGLPDHPAGDTHRDAARRVAQGAERGETGERALHHHPAEIAHQAGFFRDRKELGRRDKPAAVLPVRHRIESHMAAAERAPRLPSHRDLLRREGAPQCLGDPYATAECRGLLRPEGPPGIPTTALGLVERQIGILQQAMHLLPIRWEDSHAARQADLHALAHQLHRPGERLVDVSHARGRSLRLIGAGRQQNEFIAAQARDDILRPCHGAQAPCQLDQQRVAHVMAARVVDLLEVVDIEEDERTAARACAVVARQRTLESHEQRGAVGEAGERVVLRLMPQAGLGVRRLTPRALLRMASGRDVRLDGDEAGQRARFVPQRAAADRDPIGRAVPVVVQHFGFETFSALDAGPHIGAGRRVGAVALQQHAGPLPFDFGGRNAGQPGKGLVAPFRPPGDIRDDDGVRHFSDDEGQALGVLAEIVPGRHVLQGACQSCDPAVFIDGPPAGADPDLPAEDGHEGQFEIIGHAVLPRPVQTCEQRRPRGGRVEGQRLIKRRCPSRLEVMDGEGDVVPANRAGGEVKLPPADTRGRKGPLGEARDYFVHC